MEIKDMLLFHSLTCEEIERSLMCSNSKVLTFRKNEYIYHQNDKPQLLYVIMDGTVVLGQTNFMGREIFIEYLGEGQSFGETELFLEREEFDYFASAKTQVKVLAVSKHFFYHTCEKNCRHHSKIIFNMMQIFAKKVYYSNEKLKLLTCGTLRQRIASYLMNISNGNPFVLIPLNREDLAAYLNTTRPSLSRELSILQDKGIILLSDRRHIHISEFSLLQDEIDGKEV